MKELCVVHLVRAQNDIETFKQFLKSYQTYPSGVEHDFLIIFKGFEHSEDLKNYQDILSPLKFISHEIPDKGYDLTAYFSVSDAYKHKYRFFFFINSFSQFLANDWLKKLYIQALKPSVGMVSATGSWQSHRHSPRLRLLKEAYTVYKVHFVLYNRMQLWKRSVLAYVTSRQYIRTQLELSYFPNYHLRTNAFMISSSMLAVVKWPIISDKMDAYMFESGTNSLSKQLLVRGKKLLVVGKDGAGYEKHEWDSSDTFWQSNQQNLLISDNQTNDYQYGTLLRRKLLSTYAWGTSVKITQGIDFNDYPKVSVCIPVRNGQEYIGIAIDSILNQTYRNFELIIIDNASTDGTQKLVDNLVEKNAQIRFYKNEKDIGLIANFNACLSRATGQYIKFLCADDMLMPDCLAHMVCALEANQSAGLVTVGRKLVDQNSDVLTEKNYSKKEEVINGKHVINRCLFGANYIGEPSATMFRAESLNQGFDINFPHLVDLEMWFRLLENGDLVSVPELLCVIRKHDAQMTQQNIKSGLLVEDNVRLYDLFKDKAYIQPTVVRGLGREARMAYRLWISRKYIESGRLNEILKSHSNRILYYIFIPILTLMISVVRKTLYQFRSK